MSHEIQFLNSVDRTLEKYNEIKKFLYSTEGKVFLDTLSREALAGRFNYSEPLNKIDKALFGKSWGYGWVEGFLVGFYEGGKSMELEILQENKQG